jgi:hypothetical protein
MGEGYVIPKATHLTDMLRELREELAGVTIHYYFLGAEGRVVKKIAAPQKIRKI